MDIILKKFFQNDYEIFHIPIIFFPIILVFSKFLADLIIVSYSLFFIFYKRNYIVSLIKKNIILKGLFSFFLLCLITSFFSQNIVLSISKSLSFFRFLIFPCVIIFYLMNKKIFLNKIKILIIFLFILSLDILYQAHFGRDILLNQNDMHGTRNSGFFGDEMIAGGFLCLLFFPTLILVNNKHKTLLLLILILPTVIYFTGERSSFLLFVLGSFIYLIFNLKTKKILSYFFSAYILLLVISFFSEAQNSRMISDTYFQVSKGFNKSYFKDENFKKKLIEDTKNNERKNDISFLNSGWGAHYLSAYSIFLEHPLFGSGIKTFRVVCNDKKYDNIKSLNYKNRCSTHPHNKYFELLSDTGLLGFFGFVIFLSSFFLTLIKMKKSFFNLNLPMIIPLIIFFWPLVPSGSIFTNYTLIILSYLIGLFLTNIKLNE